MIPIDNSLLLRQGKLLLIFFILSVFMLPVFLNNFFSSDRTEYPSYTLARGS
ncbi:MAG: hypothetical protein KME55_41985 [Nostoc indistinguendum CM1-VF10]|nr:hypothetical protein [Nostoc indistinguendum CM1-VF10]